MGIRIKEVKNLATTQMTYATPIQGVTQATTDIRGSESLPQNVKQNLSNYISPVQLVRLKHDIGMWRAAINEAELAYYPHRVKMQRMFIDTALNGHVKACTAKRKRLTTLRKFELQDANGKVIEDATKGLSKKKWFRKFLNYALDANFYGYSLIALGDILNGDFPNLTIVKRWNTSPDRFNVTSYDYSINGQDFRADNVKDWHIYVDTISETGTSPCGYGLFYNVALYEIFLRNVLGYNGDFVERFSMPYVHAKTTKSNEDERGELERTVANMGANGYAITDPQDEIEFLEAALAGTGWNGYDNLEQRCEKKISKLLLGHSDALDSTPGKLGPEQGGDESPISKALSEIQIEDGRMVETIVNEDLFPRLVALGQMPEGVTFVFLNDDEVQETVERDNTNNLALAIVAKTMKEAGLSMETAYFQKITSIPTKEIVAPIPVTVPKSPIDPIPKEQSDKIKNKLNKLYRLSA
ncbi:DUF935 family protein [Mucilaginibacter sp. 10I4]|uniref:phage portal protein family protein n=1 Tax=Mucilaginibacter sp. 10I4 TaxID=3048580 RepID=UPI002B23DA0A|nr:DUF935 family protein [Mucilaginibacter sp. 10I4]MEB0262916.1 DUF935 family protein [Mucilaginibacter sp. 10I4]